MQRDLNRRVLLAAAAAAAAVVAWASPAVAAGGPDIASSAAIVPGQQMFGDTSAGEYDCGPADFWHLVLSAGDRATVDWSSLQDSDGNDYAYGLYVFPAGTTDFSINNVDPYQTYDIGENHRAESSFVAGTAGSYPLVFTKAGCDDSALGGPFNFTVNVTHAVVVSMGSVRSLRHRHGNVTLGAHRPDGQAITDPNLHLSVIASWHRHRPHPVATGSPVNGSVTVAVRLPRSAAGKKVKLRTVASGAGYRTARTGSRTVRVRR